MIRMSDIQMSTGDVIFNESLDAKGLPHIQVKVGDHGTVFGTKVGVGEPIWIVWRELTRGSFTYEAAETKTELVLAMKQRYLYLISYELAKMSALKLFDDKTASQVAEKTYPWYDCRALLSAWLHQLKADGKHTEWLCEDLEFLMFVSDKLRPGVEAGKLHFQQIVVS